MREVYDKEFIKRYLYLLENKELILGLCIDYGIEKEYYQTKIKENKHLLKKFKDKNSPEYELIESLLEKSKKALKEPKPYLMKKVNPEIPKMYEDFLFTDNRMEQTDLYKCIEGIKNNHLYLDSMDTLIENLRQRRSTNMYLKDVDPFNVWRILDYVRTNCNKDPETLYALDKYYNFDRYFVTGINWRSGYYLESDEAKEKNNYLQLFPKVELFNSSSLYDDLGIFSYYQNEFEEESDYRNYVVCYNYGNLEEKDYNFKHFLAVRDNYSENYKHQAKMILDERNLDKRITRSLTK